MNGTQDLNLNAQDCLKSVNQIGKTTYMNICNGTTNSVPWGAGDWILAGILAVIVLSAVFIFVRIFSEIW